MIRDLSETLRDLLEDQIPELANGKVVFDAPTDQFKPSQTVVDLFLYDIRENMELRSNEPLIKRDNGQLMIQRPALRVACSYLVTAWPFGGEELALQEHHLLSQTLMALSKNRTIPAKYLKGSLAGQEPPLPMVTAQPNGLKDPAEFWTALGSKLRASISVTVTISMELFAPEAAKPVSTSNILLGLQTSAEEEMIAATPSDLYLIGGQVFDAAGEPVGNASVEIVEINRSTRTDENGLYRFKKVRQGTYTLRVKSNAKESSISLIVPAQSEGGFNVQLTG